MTANFHYREKYPKELRIQIANEDELQLLRLVFQESPKGILKRYKEQDLHLIDKNSSWKKRVSEKSERAETGEAYDTFNVYEALEEEVQNMELLEDASHV
jgi:hypothetical protein